jgi:hypothetical protein
MFFICPCRIPIWKSGRAANNELESLFNKFRRDNISETLNKTFGEKLWREDQFVKSSSSAH